MVYVAPGTMSGSCAFPYVVPPALVGLTVHVVRTPVVRENPTSPVWITVLAVPPVPAAWPHPSSVTAAGFVARLRASSTHRDSEGTQSFRELWRVSHGSHRNQCRGQSAVVA